jgi:hypothetical protein
MGIQATELGDSVFMSYLDDEAAVNSALLPQPEDEIFDDTGSLYNVPYEEELEFIRWESASASQICFTESSVNRTSGHDGNFSGERDAPEGTSLMSPNRHLRSSSEVQASERGVSNHDLLDGRELPRRTQTRSAAGMERPCYTETLYASKWSTKSKKRKTPVSQSHTSKSKADRIDAYALLEKERCRCLGLPCPEQRFDLAMSRASKAFPGIEENKIELKIFFFAIASSDALVALRSIVKAHRRSLADHSSPIRCDLSQAERLKVIKTLNENIAYLGLLKRCHIHRLFVDSSKLSRKTVDGFINDTTKSITTLQKPKTGNPLYIEDAQASKSIMREVYGELEEESSRYEKKYRAISHLRRLGRRLHLLVERFGYGILGLLPSAPDVSATDPILNISDSK